jgi:carbon-monoxide dehydrogenase small subunit
MSGQDPIEPASVDTEADVSYRLRVNGTEHDVANAWLGESLLYVLRERLGLPGSKNACEQGECGSCSVLVDGQLVCACLVLGAAAVDRTIVTVEGITEASGAPSLVQQAFVDAGAVQCGFCTPGLVMTVHDLLERPRVASELELREAISGNLCRCTGYGRIIDAIERAFAAAEKDRP